MDSAQPPSPSSDSPGPAGNGSVAPGTAPATSKPSRAGRNLPAAIGVGVTLLVAVLVGLFLLPVAFVALVAAFAVGGVWEVSKALGARGISVPLMPAAAGSIGMPFAAYFGGAESLAFVLAATVLAILVWGAIDAYRDAVRNIMSGIFAVCWVPFLMSFAPLLLREHQGELLVATLLLLVVANDTFGYLVGALLGKHPMVPKISPKKSWEGFAGSVGGAVVIGVLAVIFLLGAPWWYGLVAAAVMVTAATAGDLAESMIKRELGIKDMGTSLPGHGGIMDRLDSIVFAAPAAFILSLFMVQGAM